MDRYNFKTVENKWQNYWEKNKIFKAKIIKDKKKILLFGNVSLPIWKNSYGPCKKLYYWGCFGAL